MRESRGCSDHTAYSRTTEGEGGSTAHPAVEPYLSLLPLF